MKKLLLILFFVQSIVGLNNASDTTNVRLSLVHDSNREFYLKEQLNVYKFLPSNIGLWDSGDYSAIFVKGGIDEGSFKLIDEFDKNEQFSFKSESVQSFEETGWRFYGNFTFNISDHEKADWNLGYQNSEIGNPYRLITQRTGDFNVKHYGLNGIMNKKIGGKFSLALGVVYRGDLYFRLRDTRNEFYNIMTEITGAISYELKENNHLSIGISYFYKKGSPQFSNTFYGTDSDQKLFFNEGLGDFEEIKNLSNQYYLTNQNPKYYISYFSGKQNKFSFAYSVYYGDELWENKLYSQPVDTIPESHEELYKYDYLSHDILSSYLIDKSNYKIFNFLNVKYINGTGYRYRGFYEKTYIYDCINIKASSQLLRPYSNFFNLSKLTIDFENVSKKDMLYAHQIDYTNVNANIKSGYLFKLNSNNKLAIDLLGSYKHNLSYKHDVVSAGSKNYTLNLAYNEVAYNTTNYYTIGGEIKWFRQMQKLATELLVKYQYLTPTNVKFINQYSIISDKNYRYYWEACLNFYF